MGSLYTAPKADIATGTALKTLIELATPAGVRAELVEWWCDFDGQVPGDKPILVELVRGSATITGTGLTPVKFDDFAPAANVTAKHTATAEGTPTDVLVAKRVHPTSGWHQQYPLGRGIKIPVSAFLKIRVTAAVAVNATAGMIWEE